MEMVQKLSPMGCQDVLLTRHVNLSLKSQSQEEAGLVCRADDVVLGADQVIFLCYHLEIYLLFSQRNKCNEKNKDG